MKKIIFVYNANSGYMSAVVDALHKTIRPSTYQCQLCALTYSSIAMKKQWKHFVSDLPHPTEFLHKDEFEAAYPDSKHPLPGIFCLEDSALTIIVSAQEFSKISSLDELIELVTDRI